MNWRAALRLHSWWQGSDGREFVIIDWYPPPSSGPYFTDPYVTLLEKNSEKHITQKWDDMIALVEKGQLKAKSTEYMPDDETTINLIPVK